MHEKKLGKIPKHEQKLGKIPKHEQKLRKTMRIHNKREIGNTKKIVKGNFELHYYKGGVGKNKLNTKRDLGKYPGALGQIENLEPGMGQHKYSRWDWEKQLA